MPATEISMTTDHRTATVGHADPGSRAEVLGGARAMLPWLVGVVPYGLVIGVTVGASTVDAGAGLATGLTIYSGSAQLAAIEMLEHGAAPLVAIATVLAINARLVFYSGAMAPHWRGTSRTFRALASYLLVDPSYAVGRSGYGQGAPRHLHYLGAAVTLWVAWQAAMFTGFLAGAGVPASLHLEHAVPLFLVAEVVHGSRTHPARTAAAVGALTAVLGGGLPLHAGPLVGIVAGLVAACAVDRRQP
jgi:predicted branched-subunit amino acid permease